MTGLIGFKACYLHPSKPAIKNCRSCGRPICKPCADEGSDPGLCAPCEGAVSDASETSSAGSGAHGVSRAAAPLSLGEVTVFEDGTLEERAETEDRVDPTGWSSSPPAAPPPREVLPGETSRPEPGEAGADEPDEPEPAERTGEEPAAAAPAGSRAHWRQIASALPYTLGATALVSGLWLLIAYFGRQWSQVSVFTLGLVVPWALYNSTMRKRRMGVRVYSEPPPVPYVSVTSFTIVAVTTPLLEYLAYKTVFRGVTNEIPFTDFVSRYFSNLDWLLVVCGLALALFTPFLLKVGAGWSRSATRRSKKKARTAQEPDEPAESVEDAPAEAAEESPMPKWL